MLYTGRTYTETTYNRNDNKQYYISITPLLNVSSNNNAVVGAIYTRADMASVYDSVNNVVVIFASASLIAIVIGMVLAIIVSSSITKPIEEMKRQTARIARGDYSGHVHQYGNDELGQLAQAVNNLSIRVEETQELSESERRRLDSVLSHMSDGVIATDRRGGITIVNDMAMNYLDISEGEVLGKSILDILDIRNQYTLRDLLEKQDEVVLDISGEKDLILNAYFSVIQRESGFISGIVCVLHDVTEQQKIDRERKQFVSNVSHELRTPLTSIVVTLKR